LVLDAAAPAGRDLLPGLPAVAVLRVLTAGFGADRWFIALLIASSGGDTGSFWTVLDGSGMRVSRGGRVTDEQAATLGPDPARVKDLAGLARELDRLRRRAARGTRKARVSLDDLARRTDLARSTLHTHVTGKSLVPADVLDEIVIALGADLAEQHAWAEAWQRVSDHLADRRPAARAGTGPPDAAHPLPRQLPPDVNAFTGRTQELAALDGLAGQQAWAGGPVVISAIGGTAGVGKTALAVHWAHQVGDRFPDGQLYVNLRGFDPTGQVMDPAEAIRRFLDALDVPARRIPADPDAQAALYRSELAGRRMLILLDNARDTAQVRPLLPGASGCLVVVTSRNQLTGLIATGGAHSISLDLLTPDEARQLLIHRLGEDRAEAEPDAVDDIITRCARLPLALAIAAARAATHPQLPLHILAEELRDAGQRLNLLTTDDQASNVRTVFSWSYHALTLDAARLFRLLGLHPGPDISTPATASLAALTPSRVRPVLAELTRANLIVEHTPGRYTFHDLLRAYATDLAHTVDPGQQRAAATHRTLDHYLHTAYSADRLLSPTRDPITLAPPQPGVTTEQPADHQQALAWLNAEHAVLLAAIHHAATTGFDTHTWQLAWTLQNFLDLQGHWQDQAHTGQLALAAAHRLDDQPAQAQIHRSLANAYTELGHFDNAHSQLRHSLNLYRQSGNQVGQARVHLTLAKMWELQGRRTEALNSARQALDLYQSTDHRRGQALALNSVGWCHALLGDHEQALTPCQQALTLLQELDDHHGQANTWDSLGYIHHHLGHHAEAVTCYQHAINLFRDVGDRHQEAVSLINLGDAHITDNPDAANHAWQQALNILTDLNHPDAEYVRSKLATHPLHGTSPASPTNG
jgi:tetratricopeptide (TPR) repeat protein